MGSGVVVPEAHALDVTDVAVVANEEHVDVTALQHRVLRAHKKVRLSVPVRAWKQQMKNHSQTFRANESLAP